MFEIIELPKQTEETLIIEAVSDKETDLAITELFTDWVARQIAEQIREKRRRRSQQNTSSVV